MSEISEKQSLYLKISRIATFCESLRPESDMERYLTEYLYILLHEYIKASITELKHDRSVNPLLRRRKPLHNNHAFNEHIRRIKKNISSKCGDALAKRFRDDDDMKFKLETLHTNRNEVAHGGSIYAPITEFAEIKKRIIEFVKAIDEISNTP